MNRKYLVSVPGEQYTSIPEILLQYAISFTLVWLRSMLFVSGLIIGDRLTIARTVKMTAGRYPATNTIQIDGGSRLQKNLMSHLFEYSLKKGSSTSNSPIY